MLIQFSMCNLSGIKLWILEDAVDKVKQLGTSHHAVDKGAKHPAIRSVGSKLMNLVCRTPFWGSRFSVQRMRFSRFSCESNMFLEP